ncbi:MAG: transposase [Paludibacter sp.]|nr:transposase [Paludibacter sp.]
MSSENYRIINQNAAYFLTFTVTDWIDVFTRISYKNIIVESLEFCQKNKGLMLYSWCLMTNHLHLICRVEEPFRMSDFIRDFKQFTAKKVLNEIENAAESRKDWMLYRFEYAGKYDKRITKYRFWQDTNHPIELSSNKFIEQRMNYIHQNPVKVGFVENAEDYLYSSARNYAGLGALIKIEII